MIVEIVGALDMGGAEADKMMEKAVAERFVVERFGVEKAVVEKVEVEKAEAGKVEDHISEVGQTDFLEDIHHNKNKEMELDQQQTEK